MLKDTVTTQISASCQHQLTQGQATKYKDDLAMQDTITKEQQHIMKVESTTNWSYEK